MDDDDAEELSDEEELADEELEDEEELQLLLGQAEEHEWLPFDLDVVDKGQTYTVTETLVVNDHSLTPESIFAETEYCPHCRVVRNKRV